MSVATAARGGLPEVTGRSSSFAGIPAALALAWRRNRVFWTVWVIGLLTLMPSTVTKYHEIIPPGSNSTQLLDLLAANPTMRAMLGPPFDLSNPGGFTMWRVGTFVAAAAAMMSALGVIRATRAEEEEGRVELLRSGAIGRHAPLAAAVILAVGANVVFALVQAVALVKLDTPAAGALLSGLGIGLTGAVFAGVGAVCAQIFESARTARYWALGIVLGGLYLIRAAIDGSGDGSALTPLRWAVPLEWAALARPYAGDHWWVLLLPVATTAALVLVAFRLESARDLGAGLRATRPGPAAAGADLGGARGLAWRLQRAGAWGWSIGILLAAAGMGSLSLSMDQLTEGNSAVADMMRRMGGSSVLRDAFYMAMLGILATIIALAGVVLLNRLRTEETAGRAEVMLSTDTSRPAFAWSHLAWALGLPTVLLVLTGALLPLAQVLREGDVGIVGTLVGAALALLPGVWLTVGLAFFLVGVVPRGFGLVWVLLGWTVFCTWIASLFENLPAWLVELQPWGHLPHLPAGPMSWPPVIIVSALAIVLVAMGIRGYRRRDIQGR